MSCIFQIGIGVLIKVSAVINAKPNGTKSKIDCFRLAFVFVSEVLFQNTLSFFQNSILISVELVAFDFRAASNSGSG